MKPFISRNFSAGGMEDLALPKVSSPEVCENVGVGEMESSEHDDAGEGDSYTGSVVSMTTPQKAASPVALFGEDQDALEKYSYFARGYTTEIYKIELQNLPIRIGYQVNINPETSHVICPCQVTESGDCHIGLYVLCDCICDTACFSLLPECNIKAWVWR